MKISFFKLKCHYEQYQFDDVVVAFIFFTVVGNSEFLLLNILAPTTAANRAISTNMFPCAVFLLSLHT